MSYAHLRQRLFGSPLLVERVRLDAVVAAVASRVGVLAQGQAQGFAPPAVSRSADQRPGRGVAVVQIVGTMAHRANMIDAMSGLADYAQIASDIRRAVADESVAAIMLEIDSPGGEVSGLFDLADEIRAARDVKPVWAAVNESAFSAGYALASAADRIYVPRTGGVGSIGVYALHLDQSQADAEAGLTYTYVKAGVRKADGNPHEPLSDTARASLQAEVDRTMDLFVATVAKNRNLSTLAVRATEAGLYFGEQAVEAGLADKVGTMDQAMADLSDSLAQEAFTVQTIESLKAELADRDEKILAQGATVQELQATVAQLKAQEDTRAEAARRAVLADMLAKCLAAGVSPPKQAVLDKVTRALKLDEEIGQELASAILSRCLSAATPGGKRVAIDPTDDDSEEAKVARGKAALLAGSEFDPTSNRRPSVWDRK